jgi:hypothetical protein
MPILTKYLSDWQKRIKDEFEPAAKAPPAKSGTSAPSSQN